MEIDIKLKVQADGAIHIKSIDIKEGMAAIPRQTSDFLERWKAIRRPKIILSDLLLGETARRVK
jgi:hypothetical protein